MHSSASGARLINGNLSLTDNTLIIAMQEFDRIFQSNDVAVSGMVDTVDDAGQCHADEEGEGDGPLRVPALYHHAAGMRHQLHEGDVDHDPGAGAQCKGEQAGVGLADKKCHGGTDGGAQTGQQ